MDTKIEIKKPEIINLCFEEKDNILKVIVVDSKKSRVIVKVDVLENIMFNGNKIKPTEFNKVMRLMQGIIEKEIKCYDREGNLYE